MNSVSVSRPMSGSGARRSRRWRWCPPAGPARGAPRSGMSRGVLVGHRRHLAGAARAAPTVGHHPASEIWSPERHSSDVRTCRPNVGMLGRPATGCADVRGPGRGCRRRLRDRERAADTPVDRYLSRRRGGDARRSGGGDLAGRPRSRDRCAEQRAAGRRDAVAELPRAARHGPVRGERADGRHGQRVRRRRRHARAPGDGPVGRRGPLPPAARRGRRHAAGRQLLLGHARRPAAGRGRRVRDAGSGAGARARRVGSRRGPAGVAARALRRPRPERCVRAGGRPGHRRDPPLPPRGRPAGRGRRRRGRSLPGRVRGT